MDLTDSNSFSLGQSIRDLPLNSSCTYRAVTTCGYPKAEFRIQNSTISNDFDIAWASLDGVQRDDDLNGWNFDLLTTVNGTMQSQANDGFTTLVADPNAQQITGAAWDECKGPVRNLWVSITRTKVTAPPKVSSDDFLSETPRQLQYHNGTKFNDFDIVFTNWQGGNAAVLGAISVAFAATVAALAF
jgi:hypothetical protein